MLVEPAQAGKITGMMLEIRNAQLLHILEDGNLLKSKVEEAVAQAHQGKIVDKRKDIESLGKLDIAKNGDVPDNETAQTTDTSQVKKPVDSLFVNIRFPREMEEELTEAFVQENRKMEIPSELDNQSGMRPFIMDCKSDGDSDDEFYDAISQKY